MFASAQIALPSISPNPTIEELQQLIVVLTQILNQLLQQKADYAPRCPAYETPVCYMGQLIQRKDANGCYTTPLCMPLSYRTLPN